MVYCLSNLDPYTGGAWKVNDIVNPVTGEEGWRLSDMLIKGAKGE